MSDSNVALIRRWFEEVWNQGRPEVMPELLAEDAPIYDVNGPGDMVRGPAGFRPGYDKLRNAFPDINFTIHDTIGEGDLVAIRWTARATHCGDGLGCAATNLPITISGMSFARVRDGKMVEGWNNWDMMGLLRQTGQITQATIVPQDEPG